MKKVNLLTSIIIMLLTIPLQSIAQEKGTSDSIVKESLMEKKSYGIVGANYSSDLVFLGRKGSAKTPYLSATAGYYHKSGLFISGAASFLTVSGVNRIDLAALATGYDFYLKNFSAGISGTKYFFNKKSYTVKSDISGYISVYADYDFDIVDVYIDVSTYFGNTSDFISGLALSHNFYAANDHLNIIPTFYLNAGTQNYYNNYNNNIRFGRHMLEGGSSQSVGIGMMSGGLFKVLDYELSVPVSYTIRKIRFSFTPVFAIPVNPATITNNQAAYKEDISNNFFWLLGVSFKFL